MAFQMKMSKEQVVGKDVLPAGIYQFRLIGFTPKWNKLKDAINYNPMFEVINNPDYQNRKVFDSLSPKAGWKVTEMANSLGFDLEGNDAEGYSLPGYWDGDPAKFLEADPLTWVYKGPLVGAEGTFELKVDNYMGKDNNKVEKYIVKPGFTPKAK